ncbi:MAG: HNH endonuclease [Actinobacteria bacterium]|nr:HNH endonuclease [Actinomycetota bacterium]
MDRSRIVYLTQEEFSQLDITALDKILNGIHFHRSRLDGQEVFALQARAVLTHGRNKPPDPAPRPQLDDTKPDDDNLNDPCDSDPSGPGNPGGDGSGSDNGSGGDDPGAARSKRELRDAERRAARLADYPEIAEALASGQISTEQADLISRARVSTRTKLELLADAKHEHADQTAEAVKAAVVEADTESADDRYNRQRENRRGGIGVNDDGMYWLSLLIDPITGARIKHAYDPRYTSAWRLERELDQTTRRQPKQLAGDIIANMLLGLSAVYDLHPQAQADAHHSAEPASASASASNGSPADGSESGSTTSSASPTDSSTEPAPETQSPAPAACSDSVSWPANSTPSDSPHDRGSGTNPGVRFVEVGTDADGNETRTDLGSYTPIRPAPLSKQPPDPTESDAVGSNMSGSDRQCSSCRTSGPPPTRDQAGSGGASDRNLGSKGRGRGRPRVDVNVVIGLSDLNDLADRQAVGYTSDGVPVPATAVRALMCDAEILYWVEQANSQELKLARDERYATPTQRQGLLVRDGCCVWKHCTMPASASEAHHIMFWEHGGNTDLEQLCLLCPFHHRKLHAMGTHIRLQPNSPRAWYLTRDSDGQTIKEWTNPPHRQKPGTKPKPKPKPKSGAA